MRPTGFWGQKALFVRKSMAHLGIIALTIVALTLPASAYAKYASYVVDADTGEVLHAVNEDTRNYPASLTKMMTLYLLFERLESKRWSMATKLNVSARAAAQPASKIGFRPGETITVKDAIQALVIKSANDVATVVAENMSGSERNFALRMTAKARALGMSQTTFRNASGLPHRSQLSTAKDMYILARALLRDYPQHYHYFSQAKFVLNGRTYETHNDLLTTYPGADGFKTGYIRASGFNLVSSATRDGRRIIGVVFGGRSSRQRNQHMASLLDEGFQSLAHKQSPALIAKVAVPTKPDANIEVAAAGRATELWAVQVGAFSRPGQARSAAKNAIAQASSYLSEGQIRIVPLQQRSGAVLHRARIVGISKTDAYRTCRIIKDCMELKATFSAELASTSQ